MERYAQSVGQLLAALAGVISLACGSGPTDLPAPLAGHFVALDPWVTGPGFALGLSLTVTGSAVSGAGWLGGQDNPLTPLSISGEFTDPSYTLTLSRVPTGDTVAVLAGHTTSSAMQGSLTRGYWVTPAVVVFSRTDTGATGWHTTNIAGAATEQLAAASGFGVTQATGFFLTLAYPERNFPLLSLSHPGGRLPAGTYALGPSSGFAGTVVPAYAPSQRFFAVTGGSVRSDVSTPYALLGLLTLNARDSTGATLTLTSTFSAGCGVATCL